MGTRATYDRRLEQLESAVDDLLASPHAGAGDLIRIRAVQEIDFHVRHIDRLLRALAPDARLRRMALHVLAVAEAARPLLRPVRHRPRTPVA